MLRGKVALITGNDTLLNGTRHKKLTNKIIMRLDLIATQARPPASGKESLKL